MFLGRHMTKVHSVPDETEFLEVMVFPFEDVLQMVLDSEIRDAMTMLAVLYADLMRK